MTLKSIETLISEISGHDPEHIGKLILKKAIHKRLQALGIPSGSEYLHALKESKAETDALIEEILVKETWFFRIPTAFQYLSHWVQKKQKHYSASEKLKILSIPCSTGEEPYSIAICLLEANIPSENFLIEGRDLSKQAITISKRGVFNQKKFRKEFWPLDLYFEKISQKKIKIKTSVKEIVSFKEDNILTPPLERDINKFDIIFFRNCLIYLNEESKKKALDNVYKMLKPEGVLFAGHAEMIDLLDKRFKPSGIKGSFAHEINKHHQTVHQKRAKSKITPPIPIKKNKKTTSLKKISYTPKSKKSILETAEQYANSGNLEMATSYCQEAINLNPESSYVYYLMGSINLAQNDTKTAKNNLIKSVYLDNKNSKALYKLALIEEGDGNFSEAKLYRERASQREVTQ